MASRGDATELATELDVWRDAGRTARLWLRDDDAIEPTPQLEALLGRLSDHAAPALLAVIPMWAKPALAERLARAQGVAVAVHGAWHANHCPPGRKAEETPDERGLDVILPELEASRRRLAGLFGDAAGEWYVPPWNRIGPVVAERLPELGFRVLSAFGVPRFGLAPRLAEIHARIDVMDWKGGRIGKPAAAVLAETAAALSRARAEGWAPVGVLTHHLAHDAAAWNALDQLLAAVAAHSSARWISPGEIAAAA